MIQEVKQFMVRGGHRIAISNQRIKAIDNNQVIFTYKDRQDDNKTKVMSLSAMEFIRRFLFHVLPFRFMKIRYFGFLANICKKTPNDIFNVWFKYVTSKPHGGFWGVPFFVNAAQSNNILSSIPKQ